MIQLDRRGDNDFKCYNVGTDEFRKFIETSTGYKEQGSIIPSQIRCCGIFKESWG